MTKERWKQRFENFSKSFIYLKQAIEIENPDIIQKAGLIQFFEISFELSWKTMKDYLESQGFTNIKSPRDSIKKSFEIEILTNGTLWLKALIDRNLTSHTYEEETANEVDRLIRTQYFQLLESFKNVMDKKL